MCPVNDDENVTRINQVHQLVRGDILYEFVDVPGVPDKERAKSVKSQILMRFIWKLQV